MSTILILADLEQMIMAPETHLGKQVTLRGFVYHNGHEWILATQPNIPSCCLKKKAYIYLQGNFSTLPSSKAVEVTGILVNDQGLKLKNAQLVESNQFSIAWILLPIFFMAVLFLKKPLESFLRVVPERLLSWKDATK